MIAREIGGVRKEHRFIRADAYASYDDAVSFTLNKARQIIDLQGERIFADGSAAVILSRRTRSGQPFDDAQIALDARCRAL